MELRSNGNNWGLNFMRNISDQTTTLVMIYGCNQSVRMNFQTGNYSYTVMAIPKDYVNNFVFSKTLGFGLVNFVNLVNHIGFPCELLTQERAIDLGASDKWMESDTTYSDMTGKRVESLNMEDYDYVYIPANGSSKFPYYTFCLLRTLYYCNQYIADVINAAIKIGIEKITAKDFLELLRTNGIHGSNHVLPPPGSYQMVIHPQLEEILRDPTCIEMIGQMSFVIPKDFEKVDFDNFHRIPLSHSKLSATKRDEIIKGLHFTVAMGGDNYYFVPKVEGGNYQVIQKKAFMYAMSQVKQTGYTTQKVNAPFQIFSPIYEEIMKKPVMTAARVLSRHPSHKVFRKNKELTFPAPVLIRLGSTTVVPKDSYAVEINSIPAIKTSANKLLMKQAFDKAGVPTAEWYILRDGLFVKQGPNASGEGVMPEELPFPMVVKNIFGSRGEGNTKVDNIEELNAALRTVQNSSNYIFEKFYNYAKEYRIHVSEFGPFLVWRKVRRSDVPQEKRWYFNSETCNWLSPGNSSFDMPVNMDYAYKAAVAALKAVGLTIGGVDLRIQSKGASPKFIVVEINSACAQAEQTSEAYIQEFQKIVNENIG